MKVLNNTRYAEVRELVGNSSGSLPEEYYECLANVFEIFSTFVNGKLSNQEILLAYDLISDVMKNKRPDLVVYVSEEERIRVAVLLLQALPGTKWRLSIGERIAFAFCIFTAECTQFLDEESGQIRSGIALFDTFEHIERELRLAMSTDPDRFDMSKPRTAIDERFGYSIETAISMTSIFERNYYLSRLIYDGHCISYDKIGSFENRYGVLADGYRIYIQKRGLFSMKTIEVATLYISPYCLVDMPNIAPKGFTLEEIEKIR